MGVVGLSFAAPSIGDSTEARWTGRRESQGPFAIRQRLAALPEAKAVVFLRLFLRTDPNFNLVSNDSFLDRQRVWPLHDLGPRNVKLMRAAPDRTPYLFDEATGRLIRLDR